MGIYKDQLINRLKIMFKTLKRVVYFAPNLGDAKKWYSTVLDVKPIFDAPIAVIFQVGNCTLSITNGNPPDSETKGFTEIYWEVDDFEYAFNRLIELGAKVHTPVREAFMIKMVKLSDPFGNVLGVCGNAKNPEKQTVENQPSETAMTVAFCRACAFLDEREEVRGADNLAEIFLKEESKELLKNAEKRKWTIQNIVTSNMYGYFISRTKYFDNIFKECLSGGIQQIVFLGAGYDTRPYRYKELIKNTKIFELDINSTQNRKVEILKEAKIEIPKQLSFVKINFKTDKISDTLKKSGFDTTVRTLFIWEGVVYYLTKEAVAESLRNITEISSNGSIICFDYLKEKLDSVNAGEPFLFWMRDNEMEMFLKDAGIEIREQINSEIMVKNYLTLDNGSIAEQTLSQFNFIQGEICKYKGNTH
jgi:methyltransferase (TIGR00027 family)